jgi:multicomponent K+:H+ antiporter subunit D
MSHLVIAPILLPLISGLILLLMPERHRMRTHILSMISVSALVVISVLLVIKADRGEFVVYALGNWAPPFGIVLVLDRLSAIMMLLSSTLAFFSLLYTSDEKAPQVSPHFHSLAHFLITGVNGAFLTGDLFNLFVFFEILLLSSYALLMQAGSARRAKAGLHYVILNVTGSAIFLIAVATLYGLTGTLNMADLAVRVAAADADTAPFIGIAALLLFIVFGLKAAVFPLYFWLPSAYSSAHGPVAALFAIMTKVGVYAIIRVYTLIFGNDAGELSNILLPWLWPLAFITLILGAVGALGARELRVQISWLVIVSVGTLLTGVALNSETALSATIFYLLHSTWICAALFLLTDLIIRQRGDAEDRITSAPEMRQSLLLGGLFFVAAISVIGMPPLSGFVGKALILQAATGPQTPWIWAGILLGGLAVLTALSRSGSTIFWRMENHVVTAPAADIWSIIAILGLILFSFGLMIFGNQVIAYTNALAEQILHPQPYIQAVLGHIPVKGN